MSRLFYHVMQDNAGNLLFDVSGTMRLAGSGTLATIYGDEALTVILPNPMTNHPSFGSFKCFLGAGDYDFYMAKSGYTFETLTGVQGHGTMALQDADAVAITGGTATGLTQFDVPCQVYGGGFYRNNLSGNDQYGFFTSLNAAGGTGRYAVRTVGDASSVFGGPVHITGALGLGVGGSAESNMVTTLYYNKTTHYGLKLRQLGSDTGGTSAVTLSNVAGAEIGSISTTASATSFNTTSDSRLKSAVTPLTGALQVVRALRPVAFKWRSDDTPGRGFLASEVQEVIPDGVITGTRDAVDAEGNIVPQMIDYSKLVPFLIGAVKTLSEHVEALTARLDAAGA